MLQSVNERVEQETEYQGMGLFEPRPDFRLGLAVVVLYRLQ